MCPSTDLTVSNERGIALVSALLITLILTLVVVALSYRVGLFTRGTREHVIKSQNLYTAEIGLNQARYTLMSKDCLPPNWNACIPAINSSSFTNLSSSITSVFTTPLPEFTLAGEKFNLDLKGSLLHGTSDSYRYKVYAKTTNIPKVIEIMAVSERPGEQTQTAIDAGLIFTMTSGSGYKQEGQGMTREGLTVEPLGAGAANLRSKN